MKRKTTGQKIATGWFETDLAGDVYRDALAKEIDRAIRREKAEAWDEGYVARRAGKVALCENLYRGRAKR